MRALQRVREDIVREDRLAHRVQTRVRGYDSIMALAREDVELNRQMRSAGIDVGQRVGNVIVYSVNGWAITPVPSIVPMPLESPLQARRRAYDGFGQ